MSFGSLFSYNLIKYSFPIDDIICGNYVVKEWNSIINIQRKEDQAYIGEIKGLACENKDLPPIILDLHYDSKENKWTQGILCNPFNGQEYDCEIYPECPEEMTLTINSKNSDELSVQFALKRLN